MIRSTVRDIANGRKSRIMSFATKWHLLWTLFGVFFLMVATRVFAQGTQCIIENGNNRTVIIILAALNGKVLPSDVIGMIDDMPLTAGELVKLYQSRNLLTGQKGFHSTVEGFADNFCLNAIRKGAPLTLRTCFDPASAVPMQQALTYEKLDPKRFGWCMPDRASTVELTGARCTDFDRVLNDFVESYPTPSLAGRPRGPNLPASVNSNSVNSVTKIKGCKGCAQNASRVAGKCADGANTIGLGLTDVAFAVPTGLNCYAEAANNGCPHPKSEGAVLGIVSLLPLCPVEELQKSFYLGPHLEYITDRNSPYWRDYYDRRTKLVYHSSCSGWEPAYATWSDWWNDRQAIY